MSGLAGGDRFGRYLIEGLIGQGGMGTVYRATDTVLERPVALKVIRPDRDGPEELLLRFQREARLAALVRHPNAVEIYDLGEVSGVSFLAMELLEGQSLRAYVGDPRVSVDKKLQWMLGLARGLAAAHARGLLHRDFKPENAVVDLDGGAKVVDFGLARRARLTDADRATFQTKLGFTVGTAAYMAPEHLEGLEIDGRADMFAWGLTAFELLSGVAPRFVDPLLQAPIPRLVNSVPGVSVFVSDVIGRALALRRDARFASMDDLVVALADALDVRAPRTSIVVVPPEPARPSGPPEPPRRSAPPPAVGGSWVFEERTPSFGGRRDELVPFASADVRFEGSERTAIASGPRGFAILAPSSWAEVTSPAQGSGSGTVRIVGEHDMLVCGPEVIARVARPGPSAVARFAQATIGVRSGHVRPLLGATWIDAVVIDGFHFVVVGRHGRRGAIVRWASARAVSIVAANVPPLLAVGADAEARVVACGETGAVVFLEDPAARVIFAGTVDLRAVAVLEGRVLVGGDRGYAATVERSGEVVREATGRTDAIVAAAWDHEAGAWLATETGALLRRRARGAWEPAADLGQRPIALRARGGRVVAIGAEAKILVGRWRQP